MNLSSEQWVAYLDESQQRDHYFVAAALGPASRWDLISQRLSELRASAAKVYQTPLDAEFHGHPLMNGKNDWTALRGRHRETANIYLRALSSLDGTPVRLFFRGVDVQRLNARYRYPWHPHVVCMDHVLERIEGYATLHNLGKVLIIADESSEEKQLQDRLVRHHRVGTQGYRSSMLDHICEPMTFCSSSTTDGLQVVDLALYVAQRAFHVPTERHPKAQASRKRLLDSLKPHVEHFHVWQP